MKKVILEICCLGDDSVGLPDEYFKIESPFSLEDVNMWINNDETEFLEDFRKTMIEVYSSFCEDKIIAIYDFEKINENKSELFYEHYYL